MRLLLATLVVYALFQAAAPATRQIQGQLLDSEGAVIPRASIRVLKEITRDTVQRAQSDEDGRFTIDGLAPESYLLAISAPGFAEKLVEPSSGAPQVIRLAILDCDAPGVNCDIFTAGPYTDPHPVIAHADLTLGSADALDLNRAALVPTDAPAADLRLAVRDGGLYLAPLNRAVLAASCSARSACAKNGGLASMRLDGLGPAAEICMRTNRGQCARLFIRSEIHPALRTFPCASSPAADSAA
jgi:hypothetical protein